MTGSFPIFGQPVMNEGLTANHDWIDTIRELRTYQPKHVLPGHGPLAHDAEIDFLIQIEAYFLKEVAERVERGMSLPELLSDLEEALPDWITQIAEVWGTPRYAILRVYRGLIDDPEPGWQHLKPSAIPSADEAEVEARTIGLENYEGYRQASEEAEEGGDIGLAVEMLRESTQRYPHNPAVWVELAGLLYRSSRNISSILEKGDFFAEAKNAVKRALELDPTHVPALLLIGQSLITTAHRNGDDPAPGLRHIRRALNLNLTNTQLAQAFLCVGLAHRTNGDETQAKATFAKAIAADSKFMPAQLANIA
jgi:tetratricopeptide (TPR) repeat protein